MVALVGVAPSLMLYQPGLTLFCKGWNLEPKDAALFRALQPRAVFCVGLIVLRSSKMAAVSCNPTLHIVARSPFLAG